MEFNYKHKLQKMESNKNLLFKGKKNNYIRYFEISIIILIVLNVIAIILESDDRLSQKFGSLFRSFEIFSIAVFTIEYILRIWTSNFQFKTPKLKPSIKFIVSTFGIIDLISILPFFLPLLIPFDLRFVRILRLTRLLRILKIGRYSSSFKLIKDVFNDKKTELGITIFITLILIIFSASIMFYIENNAQPDVFPNILSSIWWAVATLTTIGYGDIYPITGAGKLLSGIIALLGIGLIALPTGILSGAFIEKVSEAKANKKIEERKMICPHCKKEIQINK